MSGSYNDIDYRLRPAKAIERKMLCEALRRLSAFEKIEKYRYIGFGSTYFSDFVLFHKALNIKNMISIEEDDFSSDRFEFNKPFNCIDIKFGHSNSVLPKLEWACKDIVWLDYDGKLDNSILTDINFVSTSIVPGSFFIITVNVHPYTDDTNTIEIKDLPNYRLNELKNNIEGYKIPQGTTGVDLAGLGMVVTCRKIIKNEISEALGVRNSGKKSENKVLYKQILNFQYCDGAKMLTIAGVFYTREQETQLDKCAFTELSFSRLDDKPYLIKVPNLTDAEIRHLDNQLPLKVGEKLDAPSVPSKQINLYEEVYRYFPRFSEIEK